MTRSERRQAEQATRTEIRALLESMADSTVHARMETDLDDLDAWVEDLQTELNQVKALLAQRADALAREE